MTTMEQYAELGQRLEALIDDFEDGAEFTREQVDRIMASEARLLVALWREVNA